MRLALRALCEDILDLFKKVYLVVMALLWEVMALCIVVIVGLVISFRRKRKGKERI